MGSCTGVSVTTGLLRCIKGQLKEELLCLRICASAHRSPVVPFRSARLHSFQADLGCSQCIRAHLLCSRCRQLTPCPAHLPLLHGGSLNAIFLHKLDFFQKRLPWRQTSCQEVQQASSDSLSSSAHASLCLQMSWPEDEEDLEDLIGPAPPELAGELETVGGDERSAEVVRVLR